MNTLAAVAEAEVSSRVGGGADFDAGCRAGRADERSARPAPHLGGGQASTAAPDAGIAGIVDTDESLGDARIPSVAPGLGWPLHSPTFESRDRLTAGSGGALGWPVPAVPQDRHERGNGPLLNDRQDLARPVDAADERLPTAYDHAVSRETSAEGASEELDGPSATDGPQGPDEAGDERLRAEIVASVPTVGSDTPLAQSLALDAKRRITLAGRRLPHPSQTRIMTVANQKGGVGKTTTVVNVAASLAQAGLRVLVIDLDPQGNASTALGVDHRAGIDSVYDVLVDGQDLGSVIVESSTVRNLFCAPSTIDLAGAEIELVSQVARETRLAKALSAHLTKATYDYVLIDCPPSLGLLTINAFVAAREVFIPIQCEYYALEGLSQLLKTVDMIRTHLNPDLSVSTILLTMYDGRTRLSAQVADEVRSHFPHQTLRTTIPRSVRVSEAPSFGETVMTYDPVSSGALAYLEAASQLAVATPSEGARA
jgi:chromosome partitioning protein